MKRKDMLRLMGQDWNDFAREAQRHSERDIGPDECLLASIEVEKAHRRMGRGLSTYALSVRDAAKAMVMTYVLRGGKPPEGWRDAASIRRDVILCWALREAMGPDGLKRAFPRPEDIEAFDYAKDAVKR